MVAQPRLPTQPPGGVAFAAGASFWGLAALTGAGAGLAAAGLLLLLEAVQDGAWSDRPGVDLVHAALAAAPWRHGAVLIGAGLCAAMGGLLLRRLRSVSGIDLLEAIWFRQGRLPALKTIGAALLSIVVVGLGAPLGREGAPKQVAGVWANALATMGRLEDPARRLLVACGAGAGLSAAYGVPLGGALFALEVLHDGLSLRLVLPALLASAVAAAIGWTVLPDAVTYHVPPYAGSPAAIAVALVIGCMMGVTAVGAVRAVAWADRHKPAGRWRLAAPILVLGLVGLVSIPVPEILGNGKDAAQGAFDGSLTPLAGGLVALLKPAAILLCMLAGVPGGLFTPTLAVGALLGATLGHACTGLWPDLPIGLCALLAAAALLGATTQGPVSAIVLIMELTGYDRAFVVPLILAVVTATGIARAIDSRSIYEARLSDAEVADRLRARTGGPAS